jgi:hypothetical protein
MQSTANMKPHAALHQPSAMTRAMSKAEVLAIRQKHTAGERSLALIKWGLALFPESLHLTKLGAGCFCLLQ